MRAAVFLGKHNLHVMDVPLPECRPKEVRIRVMYCGVCGTDHHIFHGDGGAAPVPSKIIIGHEFSGIIDSIGSEVSSFKPGDRVSADPNEWCGECYYCLNGMAHFCTNMKGYGTNSPGGFAEYLCIPERQVYHLPEKLDLKTGSQSETTSCCVNGIDLCRIKPGSNVLIIGAGPIGLIMMQLARFCGAGKVIVSELIPQKRSLALKLGADVAVDPDNENIAEILKSEFQNVDCVIEAAGTSGTQSTAIALAGKASTVMLFGLVPPETTIKMKPFEIFNRELRITSSFINPYTFSRAINLLAQKKVVLDDIITDVVPLENIQQVFTDPYFRSRGKVLIKMSDEIDY